MESVSCALTTVIIKQPKLTQTIACKNDICNDIFVSIEPWLPAPESKSSPKPFSSMLINIVSITIDDQVLNQMNFGSLDSELVSQNEFTTRTTGYT